MTGAAVGDRRRGCRIRSRTRERLKLPPVTGGGMSGSSAAVTRPESAPRARQARRPVARRRRLREGRVGPLRRLRDAVLRRGDGRPAGGPRLHDRRGARTRPPPVARGHGGRHRPERSHGPAGRCRSMGRLVGASTVRTDRAGKRRRCSTAPSTPPTNRTSRSTPTGDPGENPRRSDRTATRHDRGSRGRLAPPRPPRGRAQVTGSVLPYLFYWRAVRRLIQSSM